MKIFLAVGSTAFISVMTCTAHAVEFTCRAKSHTVIIQALSNGNLEYRSWGVKKSLYDAPDLTLRNGKLEIEGTGACRSRNWTFRSGGYEYAVSDSVACSETTPPRDAVGRLTVRLKGETKADWWCESSVISGPARSDDTQASKHEEYLTRIMGTWQGEDNASRAIFGKIQIGKGFISWGGPHNPQCKTTYKIPEPRPWVSDSFPDKSSHIPKKSGHFVYRLEVDTSKCRGADSIFQLAVDALGGREADVVTYGNDGKPSGFHSFSKVGH